jgi:hypothetical protein
MSIYDDPDMASGGGAFVKFAAIGDKVSGTVTAVRKGTDFAGNPCPQLDLATDDGEAQTLTAGQANLKNQVMAQRVDVGDHFTAVYSSDQTLTGGRTMKVFTVTVKKAAATGAASKTAAPVEDDDAPPF